MAFGRDFQRRLFDVNAGKALAGVLADGPARMELVDAATLNAEADGLARAVATGSQQERGEALMLRSGLLREHSRRTGSPEALARAAEDADRAQRLLPAPRAADARLDLALCALQAAEQFGDVAALEAAEQRLGEVNAGDAMRSSLFKARRHAAQARAAGLHAILRRDLDLSIAAAQTCDEAVGGIDRLARRDLGLRSEAALARVARAELLTAFAVQLKEAHLAAQAADDLAQVSDRLDPESAPLTFARVETQRGEALCALGELTGDAAALAEAAAALCEARDAAPAGWSPVDRARAGRALAHARQALAEATEEAALFDQAAEAFDAALADLDGLHGLPLRAACAFDRALALARRAERVGDVRALSWAEGALKARLAAQDPGADPVSWAALQVALARIYGLKDEAAGGDAGRADAALALEAAIDVFTERGLKSLAEQALELSR